MSKLKDKAVTFIDTVFRKKQYSIATIKFHLTNKIEDWKTERWELGCINLFDRTDLEQDRYIYLEHLINYGEKKLYHIPSYKKTETIIIQGNNLKILT